MPSFGNQQGGLMARFNHWGLRLFKPVALDVRALGELVPADGVGETDFWLVDDPFTNPNRGRLIDRTQLSLLVQDAA